MYIEVQKLALHPSLHQNKHLQETKRSSNISSFSSSAREHNAKDVEYAETLVSSCVADDGTRLNSGIPNASLVAASKQRQVRFRSIKIRKTLSRGHFHDSEVAKYWWSVNEYRSLTKVRFLAIKALSGPIGHPYDTRGLEWEMPSSGTARSSTIKEARGIVLALQQEQRQRSVSDPDAIAEAYQRSSAASAFKAQRVATADQEEAERIQSEDRCLAKNKAGTKKKVQFKTAKYQKIPGRSHYTPEEIKSCWYTAKEYVSIRAICADTIQAYRAPSNDAKRKMFADSEYSMRGLESFTLEGSRIKTRNRRDAYRSVFEVEQHHSHFRSQKFRCRTSLVDSIAASYRHATLGSRINAMDIGSRDQFEANLIFAE